MTVMKEKVATRMAAHDRMKMMWLSAVETVGQSHINCCFRTLERDKRNFYFHDSRHFHLNWD